MIKINWKNLLLWVGGIVCVIILVEVYKWMPSPILSTGNKVIGWLIVILILYIFIISVFEKKDVQK